MKNKKGFTLIELLAVIVVLAIIALIATPVVLSAIGTARAGANKESARGFVKAAEFYCAEQLLQATPVTVTEVLISGTPTAGQVLYTAIDFKGTAPTALTDFTLDASCIVEDDAEVTVNGAVFIVGDSGTNGI